VSDGRSVVVREIKRSLEFDNVISGDMLNVADDEAEFESVLVPT
jgi:hypothetical protein